eukprot:jgi/Botrbrau1/15112/Bobra.0303s0005.1
MIYKLRSDLTLLPRFLPPCFIHSFLGSFFPPFRPSPSSHPFFLPSPPPLPPLVPAIPTSFPPFLPFVPCLPSFVSFPSCNPTFPPLIPSFLCFLPFRHYLLPSLPSLILSLFPSFLTFLPTHLSFNAWPAFVTCIIHVPLLPPTLASCSTYEIALTSCRQE